MMAAKRRPKVSNVRKKAWADEKTVHGFREKRLFPSEKGPEQWRRTPAPSLPPSARELPLDSLPDFIRDTCVRERKGSRDVKYFRYSIGLALCRLREVHRGEWVKWYEEQKFGLPRSTSYLWMRFAERASKESPDDLDGPISFTALCHRYGLLTLIEPPEKEEGEEQPKPDSDSKPEAPKPEEGSDSGSEGQPEPPKPEPKPKGKEKYGPVDFDATHAIRGGLSRLAGQAKAIRSEFAAVVARGQHLDRLLDLIQSARDAVDEIEGIRDDLEAMAEKQGLPVHGDTTLRAAQKLATRKQDGKPE